MFLPNCLKPDDFITGIEKFFTGANDPKIYTY